MSQIEDAKKYETKNPISQKLLKGFFGSIEALLSEIEFNSVFEAGCGSGYVTEHIRTLYPSSTIYAMDIDAEKVQLAKERVQSATFSVGSIYDVQQRDNSFDLVVSTEVLEHLEDPQTALNELVRISKRHILVSTPNEPLWRVANMMRLKYVRELGNTPGHIKHWGKKAFCAFVNGTCSVKAVQAPFPWTLLLCEKKDE